MKSLRASTPNGFTLIEMLVTMSLLAIVIGFVVVSDLSSFRGARFRAERSTLITVLQTARADAMNNIRQKSHGVALYPADHPTSYVLFEGASYNSSDVALREVVDSTYPVLFSSSTPAEIIFCQLSGDAVTKIDLTTCDDLTHPEFYLDGAITMTDPVRNLTFDIAINHEGAISW